MLLKRGLLKFKNYADYFQQKRMVALSMITKIYKIRALRNAIHKWKSSQRVSNLEI